MYRDTRHDRRFKTVMTKARHIPDTIPCHKGYTVTLYQIEILVLYC